MVRAVPLQPWAPPPARVRPRAALPLLFALGLALAAPACGPEPDDVCAAAYAHLLSLGRRSHDRDLRSRFIKACVESWDPDKVDCVTRATTADEALACEWKKKRPG